MFLLQAALAVGAVIPLIADIPHSSVIIAGIEIALLAIQIRTLFHRKVVLEIDDEKLTLVGFLPSYINLIEPWCKRVIPNESITSIKIGKIRENGPWGLMLPPLGAHLRNAYSLNFLWITYHVNGTELSIFYPNIHYISDFDGAENLLIQKFGSKVHLFR